MLPSLYHAVKVLEGDSFDPKRVHNVVCAPCDRTMDDYLREVKRLFEAPLQPDRLLSMSARLQEQFALELQASNLCMLPSYNHTLPTGHERGTYLALDVGGSTFRVALVELGGKELGERCMRIAKMRSYRIDNKIRALEGDDFFDWMADRIEDTLDDPDLRESIHGTLPMGLSWSFPVEQTSIRSGILLEMGKGFCATKGVHRKDLGELIMKACMRKKLDVRMDAIVNDSSATLLSRAYKDQTTRLALILGTGFNASVHLPVSAISRNKFGERPQSWHDKAERVLVNTELSMFGKNILPTTRWDEYLNNHHTRPDFQPFEHLISGRYLGEIVRLILLEAIQTAGLFGGEMPENITEPYSFDTGTMAIFESDDTASLTKACTMLQAHHALRTPPTYAELFFIRQICQLVSHRAAAYLATGIHALWSLRNKAEGMAPASAGHVTISCNGSVIEKYPSFKPLCQGYVDELTTRSGAPTGSVNLEMAWESSIFGAAVAVCCLEADDS
ncbi:actin-like ATPase domain-containing protein [Saccharata proteae CBS 121410]|uniref:Phosphotransferase n=1 Tax=Saccharata proteae CBS 121410 TaxID=1314787 RepID=A0A9P4LY15_9PEZI|nr:actin-like ATPase domain-containing protein [Saccharata proteae CBS 121410]